MHQYITHPYKHVQETNITETWIKSTTAPLHGEAKQRNMKSQSKLNTESLTWVTSVLTTATTSQPPALMTLRILHSWSECFKWVCTLCICSKWTICRQKHYHVFDGCCQAICPCNLFLQFHLPVFVTSLTMWACRSDHTFLLHRLYEELRTWVDQPKIKYWELHELHKKCNKNPGQNCEILNIFVEGES